MSEFKCFVNEFVERNLNGVETREVKRNLFGGDDKIISTVSNYLYVSALKQFKRLGLDETAPLHAVWRDVNCYLVAPSVTDDYIGWLDDIEYHYMPVHRRINEYETSNKRDG